MIIYIYIINSFLRNFKRSDLIPFSYSVEPGQLTDGAGWDTAHIDLDDAGPTHRVACHVTCRTPAALVVPNEDQRGSISIIRDKINRDSERGEGS
jgi:hypothetical protein